MKKYTKCLIILALAVFLTVPMITTKKAEAADPFLAQIVMFGGNFAPRGWAFCDGQILPIASYSALFSLLGTTYGGDGRTTFALPDLRGRSAIGARQGAGLPDFTLGQRGGEVSVTLNQSQIPSHSHAATAMVNATNARGNSEYPDSNTWASRSRDRDYSDSTPDVTMNADAVTVQIGNTGSSQAHNNMPPFLAVNYIIALQGTFPSRN